MPNPAETYEQFMVPVLFAPLADALIKLATPANGDRVLDVGSGTGIVARKIAGVLDGSCSVTGLDITPAMLDIARATSENEGLQIEWREGPAEALPFDDESFDLVVSQASFMFFADQGKALSEMHRVLAPGGRLAISVFQGIERHPFYADLHELILNHLGSSGVADIFSLGDAEAFRSLVTDAGFQHVSIHDTEVTSNFGDVDTFIAGEIDVDTASIPAMQHLDADARQQLQSTIRNEMSDSLASVTQDGNVMIPFYAQVALGLS